MSDLEPQFTISPMDAERIALFTELGLSFQIVDSEDTPDAGNGARYLAALEAAKAADDATLALSNFPMEAPDVNRLMEEL